MVDLDGERAALERARRAVDDKIAKLATISGGGADALADEYIDAVVAGDHRQAAARAGGLRPHRRRAGLAGRPLRHRRGRRAARDRLAGPVRRGLLPGRLRRAAGPRAAGQLRRQHRRPDDRGVRHRRGVGLVAADGRAVRAAAAPTMRAAVATLQSEQDRLVRLDPTARLVLRGGPGTGKTVVGPAPRRLARLQRPARHRRPHPGDRPERPFLQFVSAVLPTLGEARITQTTFDRLLGPSRAPGSDERWLDVPRPLRGGALRAGGVQGRAAPRPPSPRWPS